LSTPAGSHQSIPRSSHHFTTPKTRGIIPALGKLAPCLPREQREASRGSRGAAMSPPGRHTDVAKDLQDAGPPGSCGMTKNHFHASSEPMGALAGFDSSASAFEP